MKKKNKIKTYPIRFTTDEFLQLKENAKDYNSIAEYVREMTLNKSQRSAINPALWLKTTDNLNFEINRVGVNINQLTKHINKTNNIDKNVIEIFNSLLKEYINKQNYIIGLYEKLL